mmetsp:Transcript_16658/g.24183  ORF Transcript_16658/g.24183 Transcript_16658/m.24183 type:complete len:307 (+) Transcript_16658:42-962(+)
MPADSHETHTSLYHSVLGSATAGIISRFLCHPIDTCKAKLQFSDAKIFAGTISTAMQTIRNEGVLGLYQGVGAVIVGGVPGVVIYLISYEKSKEFINSSFSFFKEHPSLSYFSAGMIAEAACCTVFVPVDVIKERLQTQSSSLATIKYNGSIDAMRTILRVEGFRGIYKGYGATLFSYGPFSALYFLLYEESKSAILSRRSSTNRPLQLSFRDNLLCSAAAGAVASFVTNPLDLAKLRYQTQRSSSPSQSSMWNVLRSVHAQQGWRGLYRGASARVLFHTPSTAIVMALYEECKSFWIKMLPPRSR